MLSDKRLYDIMVCLHYLGYERAVKSIIFEDAKTAIKEQYDDCQKEKEDAFERGVRHGTPIRNTNWCSENHKRHGEKMRAAAKADKDLLKEAESKLDSLNSAYGKKSALCLCCYSKQYDSSGIIHETDCLITKLREIIKEPK